MAGNILWFAAARALGVARFKNFVDSYGRWLTLNWKDVERGRRSMEHHGQWFVFLGRLVPTIRSIVSIPAGLLAMRWWSFVLWSMLGTVAWTALLTFTGVWLGARFGVVERVVNPIATGVIIALVLAYVWRVVTWHRRPR